MAQEYTKEDLVNCGRLFANRLRTHILQEFYEEYLEQHAYIYTLSNGETLHLLFDKDQFCHLSGLSYFGYNGISGWKLLECRNILVSHLPNIAHRKREEIRITNFPKILKILNDPTVYLYKNQDLNYRSNYFAVWTDGKRYYKLGIGTGSNAISYGETYQVSLIHSPDNNEINPANLLMITDQSVISKKYLNIKNRPSIPLS